MKSPKQVKELAKTEIDYNRQLKICGEAKADNVLHFWMLGYQKGQTDMQIDQINDFIKNDKKINQAFFIGIMIGVIIGFPICATIISLII